MGICSVCAFVLWAKHALLSLLPTCLMETVTHQCNTLGMIGKVCDYVRVCCGNGARPLDKSFSSWRAAGWYIPEQTGISQGQEVTVTGPSPAPTEQILEKKTCENTFSQSVSSWDTLRFKCPLVSRKTSVSKKSNGWNKHCLCHQIELVYTWKSCFPLYL